MAGKKLTVKQMKFAQKYIEIGIATEAYRQSYNAENMTNETIKVEACRLLQIPHVALTVIELQESHAKRHNVTIDSITDELDEARVLAMVEVMPSAAISASMGKAKIHGLIVDKKDVKASVSMENILDEIDGTSRDLPSD